MKTNVTYFLRKIEQLFYSTRLASVEASVTAVWGKDPGLQGVARNEVRKTVGQVSRDPSSRLRPWDLTLLAAEGPTQSFAQDRGVARYVVWTEGLMLEAVGQNEGKAVGLGILKESRQADR